MPGPPVHSPLPRQAQLQGRVAGRAMSGLARNFSDDATPPRLGYDPARGDSARSHPFGGPRFRPASDRGLHEAG